MADEKNPVVAASPANPWKFALLGVAGALLLTMGAGGGWLLLNRGTSASAAAPAAAAVPKIEPEYTVHLEGFTVNLSDPQSNAFLRATMDLGLGHAPKVEATAKEGSAGADAFPMARVRDTVLTVLTACQASDLITPQGKVALKQHILDALQKSVPDLDVRDVYFTEFLVQR